VETWDLLAARSRALVEAGDPDAAVDVARAAVETASVAHGEGSAEATSALIALGHAFTCAGELKHAAVVLEESVRATTDDAALGDAWNALGLVRQAEDDLLEAERCLRHALEHRERAWGADHPFLAKSWGDLARVTFDRGGRGASVAALLLKAQGILDRALARPASEGERRELRWDSWTVGSNLTLVRLVDGRWDETIRALRNSVAHLEAFVAVGGVLPEGIRDRTDPWLETLEEAGERGVRELRERLDRLTSPELTVDSHDDIDLGDPD
jgi:tetratricopeptide (TPR) repeat protein